MDFTSKQTNPQMALCPKRHVVCEMPWERSEAPWCGVTESSAHISSVIGFGFLKPKIGSVFHHGRLSCKVTDGQGLSKQAAGDSSLDLSGESRNELGQASEGS